MPDPFQYDVFLSHNRGDKPRVVPLAERLREAGLRVWLDDWVLRPGDDVDLAIEHGLEASRTLVLCMSPAAFGSDQVGLERSTVLFRDPANQDRRFIPVLLADCDLPDTLRRFKYVDYRDEGDAAFQELLAACRAEIEAPAPVPEPSLRKKPEAAEPLAVLEQKLKGHKNWVRSVAVSPDGKWAASGSDDKWVKIWDLETGECGATLKGHAVSGSHDKTVKLWDLETRSCVGTFEGHQDWVDSVAISPDGTLVASTGFNDETLRLWDLQSGVCRQVIDVDAATPFISVAFSPDGSRLVAGGASPTTVYVYRLTEV